MKYGSVCSGIESASVAWEPMGWSAAWFSEVEPFPSAVLAHHWPNVANLGDMTQLPTLIAAGLIEAPEILVGGTPCQAFSVAGMRKGLDDERGQLTIKYVEVANEIDKQRPDGEECIAVWENVPGVLSSKDNAFGCFLGALVGEDDPLEPAGKRWTNAGIVYGPQRVAAWRVLDAQYFGVAQRRRRVFVVASARKGFDPAAVLFESESLRRDTPPSRETREETAGNAGGGANQYSGFVGEPVEAAYSTGGAGYWRDGIGALRGREQDSHENIVASPVYCIPGNTVGRKETSGPQFGKGYTVDNSYTLDTMKDSHVVVHGSQDPCVSDKAFALGRNGGRENAVCFAENSRHEVRLEGGDGQRTGALSTGGGKPGQGVPTLHAGAIVRRFMPVECERLQGFPDDHTLIDWRSRASKKKIEADVLKYFLRKGFSQENAETAARHPDGPRYKAIGNSKAVPVIRWVGERIKKELRL